MTGCVGVPGASRTSGSKAAERGAAGAAEPVGVEEALLPVARGSGESGPRSSDINCDAEPARGVSPPPTGAGERGDGRSRLLRLKLLMRRAGLGGSGAAGPDAVSIGCVVTGTRALARDAAAAMAAYVAAVWWFAAAPGHVECAGETADGPGGENGDAGTDSKAAAERCDASAESNDEVALARSSVGASSPRGVENTLTIEDTGRGSASAALLLPA